MTLRTLCNLILGAMFLFAAALTLAGLALVGSLL
jgi:hypothetical protein